MEMKGSKQYIPIVYLNTHTYTKDLIAYCSHLLAVQQSFPQNGIMTILVRYAIL